MVDLASQPSVMEPHEERLLGHLRRLQRTAHDFRIEVFGSFKGGTRMIEIRAAAYERYPVNQLEDVLEAVD